MTDWCQVFGVNMGFSDKDRILMENLYVLKSCKAKNLLRNFRLKVGDCLNWTSEQDEVAALVVVGGQFSGVW